MTLKQKNRLQGVGFFDNNETVILVSKCPWQRYGNVLERCVDNLHEGPQANFYGWPLETTGKQY